MDYNQNNNSSSYQNTNYSTGNNGTYGGGMQQQNANSWSANTTNAYTGGNSAYNGANMGNASGKKPKKEKKSGGFGKTLAKCAAIALVCGLVGGGVFAGTNYALNNVFNKSTIKTANIGQNIKDKEDEAGKEQDTKEKAELKQASKEDSNNTASSGATALDVSGIVDSVMPSIVAITNMSETQYQNFFGQTGTYENESCGSGIIVSENDECMFIVTNNHVVEGAKTLTVQFIDDSTAAAEVKGTDASSDLAVIQVKKSSMQQDTLGLVKVATLGDSDSLKVGEPAIAIGNALGYGQSVTTGVISALDRSVSMKDENTGEDITNELIQTDAAINPGNSGGALLNMNGEVIGINEVKYSDTSVEGMGYSIPISKAASIIDNLINREVVDEAYLGINGVNVTTQIGSAYNMPEGIYVAQVVSGSPAEAAGVYQGDIITSFDGQEVKSMSALKAVLAYYEVGSQVNLTLQRPINGQYVEQTVTVTLGNKPQQQ